MPLTPTLERITERADQYNNGLISSDEFETQLGSLIGCLTQSELTDLAAHISNLPTAFATTEPPVPIAADEAMEEAVAHTILNALEPFTPDQRLAIMGKVRQVWCQDCGIGDKKEPNPQCHCWNDE